VGKEDKARYLLWEEGEEEFEFEEPGEEIDIYEGEKPGGLHEEIVDVCASNEVATFTLHLAAKIVNEALSKGIRIVFDVEPVLHESVLSLYSVAAFCSKVLLKENAGTVVGSDGRRYRVSFSLFKIVRPQENEVSVVIMREKPEKFWDDLELLVSNPRLVFFIVTRGRPELHVSTAVYFRNLAAELVAKTFDVMEEHTKDDRWGLKKRYIGRVPFDVLLHFPLEVAEEVARTWTPPPPPNADYLHKKPRPLSDLVLPKSVKAELRSFIEVAKEEGRGSILLVGLPSSGRKTVAAAIAAELGLPAYHISIANILSRWVGESESKLKALFEGMRAKGGLVVFENVESLFRKVTGESVTPNLRTVLFQEMARDDNNFIVVFTSYEDAAPELFDSPLIGEVKLAVPPPNSAARRALARMFLPEIAGDRWGRLLEIARRQYGLASDSAAEEALYARYADPFVEPSAGMTSGELYRSMRRVLIPALNAALREGRLVPVDDQAIALSKRDYAARQARLKMLRAKAILLGQEDIADAIMEVEREVRRRAIERSKEMEKYKEY